MDENQFRMNHGKGTNYISSIKASTGRVSSQDIPLEFIHQSRDVLGNGKGKVTLGKVNLPVPPCPRVDGAKPGPVNLADIVCRKPMVATIRVEQFIHRSQLFLQFDAIHFALLLDPKEVSKNTTT
jgi:hypothetical protein